MTISKSITVGIRTPRIVANFRLCFIVVVLSLVVCVELPSLVILDAIVESMDGVDDGEVESKLMNSSLGSDDFDFS